MPKGPRGEKRPADVIRAAVIVAKIATGEIEETRRDPGKEYARKGGLKGKRAPTGTEFQTETVPTRSIDC